MFSILPTLSAGSDRLATKDSFRDAFLRNIALASAPEHLGAFLLFRVMDWHDCRIAAKFDHEKGHEKNNEKDDDYAVFKEEEEPVGRLISGIWNFPDPTNHHVSAK